jgi:hypothetical protein
MSAKDNGGPAFPCELSTRFQGMTLRDYFAAKAMPQAASRYTKAHEDGEYLPEESYPQVAFCAYKLADAMLAERAK